MPGYDDPSVGYDDTSRAADRFALAVLALYRRGGAITRGQVRQAAIVAGLNDPASRDSAPAAQRDTKENTL